MDGLIVLILLALRCSTEEEKQTPYLKHLRTQWRGVGHTLHKETADNADACHRCDLVFGYEVAA